MAASCARSPRMCRSQYQLSVPNTLRAARAADMVAQRDYARVAAKLSRHLAPIEDPVTCTAPPPEASIPTDLVKPYVAARRRAWLAWQELCRVRWEMAT